MSYENAPSTQLLATHCAVCGRPLRDAVSIETGVGPKCREKYGYSEAQGQADFSKALPLAEDVANAVKAIQEGDAHKAANVLIYHIAAHQQGPTVARWTAAVAALGYTKMAEIVANRIGAVRVLPEGDVLLVTAPYSEEFNNRIRSIRGQRWDRERSVRIIPVTARQQLWSIMKQVFQPGTVVIGRSYAVI
jgi:hypothetical protein